MRKEFCHHDVCQVQDNRGFQVARATKSGTGSLQREPSPTTSCTVALAPVPSVSPRKCVQSHFHPSLLSPHGHSTVLRNFVTCCLVSDRIFGSTFCSPRRPRQASSHGSTASVSSRKRRKFFGLSLSLSYLPRHTNSLDSLSNTHIVLGLSLVHDKSTFARSWCHSAPQLHGSLGNCQDTSIPTSQQPPCICTLQSQVT